MTPRQQVVSVLIAVFIFLLIFYLVRGRKLKEEYSWLWLMTGAVTIVLTLWGGLIQLMSRLIGSMTVTTTLFLFALIFLVLLSLQFSVAISLLVNRVKNLNQEIAIIKSKLKE